MTSNTLLFACCLLPLAVPLERLATRWRMPTGLFMLALGYAAGELCVVLGWDTGLRWDRFKDLITQCAIPTLVFYSVLAFQPRSARHPARVLLLVLLLSLPLTLLVAGLTALLLYYGIGAPQGFPWLAALLTGTLLSCTDASPLISTTRRLPAKARMLLEGETMGTEASAIALFMFLLALPAQPGQAEAGSALTQAVPYFFYYTGGGLLLGAAFGLLARPLLALAQSAPAQLLITLALAYGLNLFASNQLGISGVMAVAAAALVVRPHLEGTGHGTGNEAGQRIRDCRGWWKASEHALEHLVFLLAGVTFQWLMFEKRWLAILIGIGAVLIARALVLAALTPTLPRGQRLGLLPPLFWGGSCGVITLALALALPTRLNYWFTVQSIAYGVVLFGLLVQGITFPRLCDRGAAHPRVNPNT